MALTKYKLGELIELCDERNSHNTYTLDDVKGISIKKEFIETKADMSGVSLSPYILVKPDSFAYVTVTSRNGEKITLAHNTSNETYIVSSSYVVFKVCRPDLLLSNYLFMYFNRPEFDRYARFNSWGSARETFSWEDMCDVDITLPSIDQQRKYVNIYLSLKKNLEAYQSHLDDLKLVCDGYIEDLRRKMKCEKIGEYIEECDVRNTDGKLSINDLVGISTDKEFIDTKADMNGVSLLSYKIVDKDEFVYVSDTSRRGDKIAIALNNAPKSLLVSSIYTIFKSKDCDVLHPDYLSIFFNRSEFDRYTRYHSWGSAREVFTMDDMNNVAIPIPDIKTQRVIVSMYKVYKERQRIATQLKEQLNRICPILIKGSLETEK